MLASKLRLPANPAVNDEEAIDKCVEEMTSAVQASLAAFAPKLLPPANPLVFRMEYT
jgi:hypothetical protein